MLWIAQICSTIGSFRQTSCELYDCTHMEEGLHSLEGSHFPKGLQMYKKYSEYTFRDTMFF